MKEVQGWSMQPALPAPEHAGYWCVVCGRRLLADEFGVIVHDNVSHPAGMRFDDEDRPQ